MRRAAAVALLCLLPTLAPAQRDATRGDATRRDPAGIVTHVETAADLAAVCDPGWGGVARLEAIAYCQGYLTSFGQLHTLLHPAGVRGPRPLYCLPTPGPSIADSGLGFAAWLRANPNRAAEPAQDGLLRWAEASFPCPRTAARPTR